MGIKGELAVSRPQGGSSSTLSRSNWNLEMLVLEERRKPEYPEKNSQSKDENQLQTEPHLMPSPGLDPGPHGWVLSPRRHPRSSYNQMHITYKYV